MTFRLCALATLVGVLCGPVGVVAQAGVPRAPVPTAATASASRVAAAPAPPAAAATPAATRSAPPAGLAASAPAYHFSAALAGAGPQLGRQVLTDEERDFIASLPVVRVGLSRGGFAPYEVLGTNGEVSGIHPEMLVSLAGAFGLRIRPVVFDTWPQTLAAAKAQEVDMLMSMGVTAERAEFLEFTLGATPTASALFARTPGSKANAAPEKAVFAIERGYLANTYVQRQFPRATILAVDSTGEALQAVATGRADYYSGSLLPATDWLLRMDLPGVEVNRLISYGSGHYHFAVRKDWARLATILNKGISSLRGTTAPQLNAALAKLSPTPAPPKPLTQAQAAALIERPTWRVGAVRGLVLLNDVDANRKHSGIGAEYVEAVARHYGAGLQVRGFDSEAAMLDALRAGLIDVVPFLTRTDERAAEFAYSVPYVEMPYVIVARSDAPLYWDLQSLHGKRLALAPQHPLRPLLARNYPDIRVVDVASGTGAMDAVASGLADAAVEVKFYANLRILADNDGLLRMAAVVTDLPGHFHFATSQAARALLPLINEALAEIPQAERLRMLRRWVAQDVTPAFPWRRHAPALAVAAAALLALALATVWWMRRLQREVRARRASEELLREVGATLPCVAFRSVFGAQGAQISSYYSEGAEAFLGFAIDPSRTLLQNIGPRLVPEERAAAEALQNASLKSGERIKITGQYQHPDGRLRWLHSEAVAQRDSDGLSRLTGYVVDVSTERRLQAKLVQAERARHLLLASASHELRAPAHTLSLALQAMAAAAATASANASAATASTAADAAAGQGSPSALPQPQPTAAAADPLQVARDAARTLTQLLNDVLDTARLDHGELALRPQAFALRHLIDELHQASRIWAAGKGLACDFEVSADVPAVVVLDPMRLRQVATNLLSNAVKYTAQGRVGLHVSLDTTESQQPWLDAEARPAAQTWLCLRVVDTGGGIAADRLAHVFTPYVAADGTAAPAEGSTGLGLSVCRRLVKQMGGQIELHSQPGQGTRVEVRLPLPPAREAVPTGPVLVCDDDDISRTLLAQMLMLQGFDVIEAREGGEALQRWRQGDVHALITDLDMAGVSGLQLIERLRTEQSKGGPGAADTRVLVCSGSLVPEVALGTSAPQHDAYLAKPVDMAVLVDTLLAVGVRPSRSIST